MTNWGGKREGAGRKQGMASILADKTKDYIALEIDKNVTPLVQAQVEKAKGGDTIAFRELLDRGFGNVKESMDMTQDG